MEPYVGNDAVLKYFETYDRETWTYEHFLNELRETIITSPPDTDDWGGLDGTWYNRYIYHANKNENDKRRQMKSFFQDIVLEREKRNAGKNYVIEGVRVLNEARFRSSNEVISAVNKRYPEDQASENENTSHKRQCRQTENDDEPPRTPEDKIRTVTFEEESSTSAVSYIPAIPVESSASNDPVVDIKDEDVFNTMLRETYLKIRQDIRNCLSQRDWNIEDYNVSRSFRDYQIANINKLEDGAIFFFSSDIEEILSLHYIMLIDLTRMKRPTYIIVNERNWRASIRQPVQPDPASFFGDIMNEYEKVINDIDELRLKFYKMWGKYCDKVIYSDEERRLFETTQIVARVFYERMHMYPDSGKDENEDTVMHEYIHDTFKETFRDSNYDTVWANSESSSSKDYRSTYGRSQGKKTDLTIYRIIEKGEREESCFIEAKPFSVTRTSKVGGYNLYKVAIFCQGGINNILLCENEPGAQTFGGHICEGYIYFCMMDLEYDGIYRFFQLSEIKIARKLSEFNLVRKLILETYFFKCRIDSYYSNRNNYSSSLCSSRFIRNPTVTPKAPKNSVPDVSLKKQKLTKKRKSI